MNKQLQSFARTELKNGLAKLPKGHHRIFKLMYAPFERGKTVKERIEKYSIGEIVDLIEDDKLDWAMQQVQNSLDKLEKTNV